MSLRSSLVLLTSLALAACGSGKMTDLEEYAQGVKERKPGPIEALPEISQINPFVFEPGDRRDPFAFGSQSVEPMPIATMNGLAPDPLRRKEELEQFSLDSLKMVGTLEQGDSNWGLIETPAGTLYRVRAGNYMGMNNGQITRITEDEIEITEIVSDGAGDWRERQAAVALSQ